MKNRYIINAFAIVFLVLSLFALCSKARAVVPAPDGGYPGGNTAEGQAALLSLTTGGFNTALGFFSLRGDTTGQFNTAVGAGTLLANTANENTATGAAALLSNTTGALNTADGAFTLLFNTTGSGNTAGGVAALEHNTTGNSNTGIGDGALQFNTAGNGNTATGADALGNNTGDSNTAVGDGALQGNTTGAQNTAIGADALLNNTTGGGSIAIGIGALFASNTGSNNIGLGFNVGSGVTTATNVICIGNNLAAANVNNTCFIGNIRGVTTQNNDAIPVLIDSAGQLGTTSSSRRYKTDIKPMDKASESILALKPVSFRYKVHKNKTSQFGLIAEDVAKVNPDLVIYDADGKPYTVRYDAVNAMLLNEFLKEHKAFLEEQHKTQRLEATVAQQQKQIEAVTAGLRKVSAQLGASKPAPQVVNNP